MLSKSGPGVGNENEVAISIATSQSEDTSQVNNVTSRREVFGLMFWTQRIFSVLQNSA